MKNKPISLSLRQVLNRTVAGVLAVLTVIQATRSFAQNVAVAAPSSVPPTDEILTRWQHVPPDEIQNQARAGKAEAQFVLAMEGIGEAEKSFYEVMRWRRAARSNGVDFTEKKNPESEAKWKDLPEATLQAAAKKGDGEAQWFLASQIDNQAMKELADAISWLKKAAAQGFAPAEYELGGIYFKGNPVEFNTLEDGKASARRWFQKAADQGCEPAQHRLARMLLENAEDIPRAVELLRAAADQGCPLAEFDLAQQYACGHGDPRDAGDTPLALLRKGATNGLPEAKLGLADRYRMGLGVQRDLIQAIHWYRDAYTSAETYPRNDKSEHFKIASNVDENDNVQGAVASLLDVVNRNGTLSTSRPILDPDLAAIMQLETKALDLHQADAEARLGELFQDGTLTQRDDARAFLWYSLAAAQNVPGAATRRDELKSRMSPADFESVEKWRKKYQSFHHLDQ